MIYRNPLGRFYHASIYSLSGLAHALRHEQAFRYEFVVFVTLCVILALFHVEFMLALFLAFMWVCVMAIELVNSATEKAFDLIDEHYRPEIKAGKDMLSAAVFVLVCVNIFAWVMIIVNSIV